MSKLGRPVNAISPTRSEDFPQWYQAVIAAGELADQSPVRGCMIIKPWGYAIWERIQRELDFRLREKGHENAYFPLFIPLSFLEKEAQHVEGFAKECAVVTHHRLEANGDGGLVPAGELEEPLVVRPTSETIIGAAFAKWIQSYRDLPLLINQWANVVRWEMRTRPFLRTAEFLWQEGHTAHATSEEAIAESEMILDLYRQFAEELLAIPVIAGRKPTAERFPGAVTTLTIEALLQDNKALQAGTSHFLGQNFALAQGIRFSDAAGAQQFAWTTSWGVSTRLIGALVMSHADDNGMVVPPRLAPVHVVILPVAKGDADPNVVLTHCERVASELRLCHFRGRPLEVKIDTRDSAPAAKFWSHVKRGTPIIVEIGSREADGDSVTYHVRDDEPRSKFSVARSHFVESVTDLLDGLQLRLLQRAQDRLSRGTVAVHSQAEFVARFEASAPGFVTCFAADTGSYQELLKQLGVTPRCIPTREVGRCIFTGATDSPLTFFAKAY